MSASLKPYAEWTRFHPDTTWSVQNSWAGYKTRLDGEINGDDLLGTLSDESSENFVHMWCLWY